MPVIYDTRELLAKHPGNPYQARRSFYHRTGILDPHDAQDRGSDRRCWWKLPTSCVCKPRKCTPRPRSFSSGCGGKAIGWMTCSPAFWIPSIAPEASWFKVVSQASTAGFAGVRRGQGSRRIAAQAARVPPAHPAACRPGLSSSTGVCRPAGRRATILIVCDPQRFRGGLGAPTRHLAQLALYAGNSKVHLLIQTAALQDAMLGSLRSRVCSYKRYLL
jgi:hypothetical protein